MRQETYNNYIRVSKRTAEKAYNAGKIILIAPVNANMNYIFFPGVYVDNTGNESFNRIINGFEYYNCNSELGKYTKFFIEQEEQSADNK